MSGMSLSLRASVSRAGPYCVVAAAALVLAGCVAPAAVPAVSGSAGEGAAWTTSSGPAASQPPRGMSGAGSGSGLLISATTTGNSTTVRGFDRTGQAPVRSVPLDGHYQLPVVTTSGQAEGISYNGATVVLTETSAPAVPVASRAHFAVLDATLTATPRIVELPARFSYDALSPDGSKLYLIEHLGPAASEHYQVRSYDLRASHLDAAVIADKTRITEWMAGHPTSRVTSTDGTIVATLYQRDGGQAFVHVLHAADGFATCIDLPRSAAGLRLKGSATSPMLMLQDEAGLSRFSLDAEAGTVTGPAAACAAAISRSALPEWARTGFSGDGSGVAHVQSAHGHMIAVLFGFPLKPSADPTVEDKVLWIPGPQPPGPRPDVAAQADPALYVEGTLQGDTLHLRRTLAHGPGPSGVNFPQAGCWHLTLRWQDHTDTLVMPVG